VGRDEGVLREVLGGLDGVGGEGGKGHGVLVGDVGTVGFWEGVKGLVSFFLFWFLKRRGERWDWRCSLVFGM